MSHCQPRRLERSCARRRERSPREAGPSPGDWIRSAPAEDGIERIEAFFSGYAFDPHRHDTYALGVTLSGVQTFDYRGEQRDSLAGRSILLHPDERHNGRAGAPSGFRYRMLYLAPRLIADALGDRAAALPFAAPVTADARMAAALRLALDGLSRPLEPLERDAAIVAIADALLALDPSAARRRGSARQDRPALERARQHLETCEGPDAASEALERATGLDRYALARQFRARYGASPYRYLTMRRLDRAKMMLRGGATLADAAFACGFADQSHMTRQFAQAFGMPPGRWRAMQTPRVPQATSTSAAASPP